MPRRDLIHRPQPFLGLLLVAIGWALSHQLGSDAIFDDCVARHGGFVVLVSLVGLAITAAGGLYCLSAWRGYGGAGRRFMGLFGALLSLIAGFAMVLQIAAGLILPSCAG